MDNFYHTMKALQFGGLMVYPLLLMGLMAAIIILDKAFLHWQYGRLPGSLLRLLENDHSGWADLEDELVSLGPGSYFVRFFGVILTNRTQPQWWVESRAAKEARLIEKSLKRGLWVLETVVTGAPLLGLVGTIVGMMDSFKLIGGSGLVNPTGITGGVAQALIATTLGLVIALIALFAFNFFSHLQSRTIDEMERLGTDLIDHIRREQEGLVVPGEMAGEGRRGPMKIPRSREARQGRIQIIPMIDVMFFLLATFMLASLSLQNLHSLPVNLPEGRAEPIRAHAPVTLTITKDKTIFLDATPVTLATLTNVLKPLLNTSNDHVIVAADSAAPQGVVVKAMLEARRAGAQHFLIAVKYDE